LARPLNEQDQHTPVLIGFLPVMEGEKSAETISKEDFLKIVIDG
jgi:hypothetical protein